MAARYSHRFPRDLDLAMRVFQVDSSWYENYWLKERKPRSAGLVARILRSWGCDSMLDHALAKIPSFMVRGLIGRAKDICEMFPRAGERRRLSKLSDVEWRDLGIGQVRRELSKWPWEQ
jgi:hypothetical protein